MTKSEYYNKLVEVSTNGGFPSVISGACQYRTGDGKSCAVGIAIPDEVYKPSFEHCSIVSLVKVHKAITERQLLEWTGCLLNVVSNIQALHDDLSMKVSWNHEKFVKGLNKILGLHNA
ncbi:MAG: hypothetical protein ACRCZI_13635 [Cetobacterium sp.]